MAAKDLHEAAVVLEGAARAIEQLMADVAEAEADYLRRYYDSPRHQEDFDAIGEETGYTAFIDASYAVRDLLEGIEERSTAEVRRREEDAA